MTFENSFRQPSELDLHDANLSEHFRRWERQLNVYMAASGADLKTDQQKTAIILHCAGPEVLEVYDNFVFATEADKNKPDKVLEKLRQYCTPKDTTLLEIATKPSPVRSQSFLSHSRPSRHVLSHRQSRGDGCPGNDDRPDTNEESSRSPHTQHAKPKRMESFHYVGTNRTPAGLSRDAAYYRQRYLRSQDDEPSASDSQTYSASRGNDSLNQAQDVSHQNYYTPSYKDYRSRFSNAPWLHRTPSFTARSMEQRNYVNVPSLQSTSYPGRRPDFYSGSAFSPLTYGNEQSDVASSSFNELREKQRGRRSLPASVATRNYENIPHGPFISPGRYDPDDSEDDPPPAIPPPPKPEDMLKIGEPIYASVQAPTRDYQTHEKYPSWPVTLQNSKMNVNLSQPISTRANSYQDHTNTSSEFPRKHKLAYEPFEPKLRPLTERSGSGDDTKSRATSDPGLKTDIVGTQQSAEDAELLTFSQAGYPPPRYDSDGHNFGDKDYNVPSPPERDMQINPKMQSLDLDNHISNLQTNAHFFPHLEITCCDSSTSPMQSPSDRRQLPYQLGSSSNIVQETRRAYIVKPKPYYNTSTQTENIDMSPGNTQQTGVETKNFQCQVDRSREQEHYKKPEKTFQEKSIQARMSIKSVLSDGSDQNDQPEEFTHSKEVITHQHSVNSQVSTHHNASSTTANKPKSLVRNNSTSAEPYLMEYTPMLRKLSEEMYSSHNKQHLYPERRLSTSSSTATDVIPVNSSKSSSLTPAESYNSVLIHSDVSSCNSSDWGSTQTLVNDDHTFYHPKNQDFRLNSKHESDPLAPAELRRIIKQGRYSLDSNTKISARPSQTLETSRGQYTSSRTSEKEPNIMVGHSKQISAPVPNSSSLHQSAGSSSSIPRSSESLTSVSSQNSYECIVSLPLDDSFEVGDSVFKMDPVHSSFTEMPSTGKCSDKYDKSESFIQRKQSMKKAYGIYDETDKNLRGAISRSSKSWHNLQSLSKDQSDVHERYASQTPNKSESEGQSHLHQLQEISNLSEKKWQQAVQRSKSVNRDNYANANLYNKFKDNKQDDVAKMWAGDSAKVLAGNVRRPSSTKFRKPSTETDKKLVRQQSYEINSKFGDVTQNLKKIEKSLAKYGSSVGSPQPAALPDNCIKSPDPELKANNTEEALLDFMKRKMKQTSCDSFESPQSGVTTTPKFDGKADEYNKTPVRKTSSSKSQNGGVPSNNNDYGLSPVSQSRQPDNYLSELTRTRGTPSSSSSSSSGQVISIPYGGHVGPLTPQAKQSLDLSSSKDVDVDAVTLEHIPESRAVSATASPEVSAMSVKPLRRPPPPVPDTPTFSDENKPPKLPPRRSHAKLKANVAESPSPASTTEKLSAVGNLRSMFEATMSSSPREDSYRDQLRRQARRLSEQHGQQLGQQLGQLQSPTTPQDNQQQNQSSSPNPRLKQSPQPGDLPSKNSTPSAQRINQEQLPTPPRVHLTHSTLPVSISHSFATRPTPPQEATSLSAEPATPNDTPKRVVDESATENTSRDRTPVSPLTIVTDERRGDNSLNSLPLPSPLDSFDLAVDNEDNFPLSPSDLPPPPPELLDDGYPSESYGSYKNSQTTRQCGVYRRSSSAADVETSRDQQCDDSRRLYDRRLSEGDSVLQSESQYRDHQALLASQKLTDGSRVPRSCTGDVASSAHERSSSAHERSLSSRDIFVHTDNGGVTRNGDVNETAQIIDKDDKALRQASKEVCRRKDEVNNGEFTGFPPKVSATVCKNDVIAQSNHTPSRIDKQETFINRVSIFEAKRVTVMSEGSVDKDESPRTVRDIRNSYENLARSCEDLSAAGSPRLNMMNSLQEKVRIPKSKSSANVENSSPNEIKPVMDDLSHIAKDSSAKSSESKTGSGDAVHLSLAVVPNGDAPPVEDNCHCVISNKEKIVISHRRHKSFEEIQCEKQAKLLASELKEHDSKLLRVISPSPDNKDTMHYMNGLFENNNNKGENTPDSSPDSLRNKKNERSPLPANSPYWMSSAKAKMESSLRDTTNSDQLLMDITDDKDKLVLKKGELVCSIEKKLEVLREEKLLLEQEISDNNATGQEIAAAVDEKCQQHERSKFKSYTEDLDKIVRLLLKLSGLLARADNAINCLGKDADDRQKRALHTKRERLSEQHEEAKGLKVDIDRRHQQVVAFLMNSLSDDMLHNFNVFVESKSKFIIEMQELDDKLSLGEEQLAALRQSMEDL